MLERLRTIVRMASRLLALPYCYFALVNWKECTRSRLGVASDLLYIYFRLRYFPDNYSPCRFDEKPREAWSYYYGSSYNPIPRSRLSRYVQRWPYQVIFNDKAVSELVCRGAGVRLPQYFGELHAVDDCVEGIRSIFKDGPLPQKVIIKPVTGSAGRGIVVAHRKESGIVIDDGVTETPLDRFRLKGDAIVQEYIAQHPDLAAISKSSVNTVRLLTLWTRSGEVLIMSASMRFGVGRAHVDNWSAGGIAVGIDHASGRLMGTAFDKRGKRFDSHPDTGFRFSGFQLPFWPQTVEIARQIQKALDFYRLIGVDVAITADGPVLVEINARPDIVFQEQTAGPLLRDPRVLRALSEYDLLYNDAQRRLASGHCAGTSSENSYTTPA